MTEPLLSWLAGLQLGTFLVFLQNLMVLKRLHHSQMLVTYMHKPVFVVYMFVFLAASKFFHAKFELQVWSLVGTVCSLLKKKKMKMVTHLAHQGQLYGQRSSRGEKVWDTQIHLSWVVLPLVLIFSCSFFFDFSFFIEEKRSTVSFILILGSLFCAHCHCENCWIFMEFLKTHWVPFFGFVFCGKMKMVS